MVNDINRQYYKQKARYEIFASEILAPFHK